MSDQEQARASFRAHLVASGQAEATADEVAATINLDAFTVDDQVDTAKLHGFAKKIGLTPGRRRSYGAGTSHRVPALPDDSGRAEAERRYGKREEPDEGQISKPVSRNYGAGQRRERATPLGGRGRAEAERRYGKRS